MREQTLANRILRAVSSFLLFFVTIAFLVSCTTMLFVSTMRDTLGLTLTEANIQSAAKITFVNVIILSALFYLIDVIRRKTTTERATRHITTAASKMVKGDFTVRIAPINSYSIDESYNVIIDCFNKMAEELASVETLRTDFISNVSHEMKTPLAVIQNYGRLLAEPNLPDQKRIEYANALTEASRRLSDMMTNILKLNRLENQQIYPKVTKYDLGEQLCESLLQFERVWEKKGIEIETDIAEGVTVLADAELLSLVWNNLFSNAFKFTESGGRVGLGLTADGEYATVIISDTGCGMTPEVGAHIFEKFYQGDTSHATEGNGLGLPLVKRVVDILGGEIGVKSTLGEGTTFTVRIRLANNDEK